MELITAKTNVGLVLLDLSHTCANSRRSTTRAAMVVLLSVMSVCLSVCQHDNYCTVKEIVTDFSGHHTMVERADKFEIGYIGVRGW